MSKWFSLKTWENIFQLHFLSFWYFLIEINIKTIQSQCVISWDSMNSNNCKAHTLYKMKTNSKVNRSHWQTHRSMSNTNSFIYNSCIFPCCVMKRPHPSLLPSGGHVNSASSRRWFVWLSAGSYSSHSLVFHFRYFADTLYPKWHPSGGTGES